MRRVDLDVDRLFRLAARERLGLERPDRLLRRGRIGVRPDGHDRGRDVAVREGVLDALNRLHGRCALGERLETALRGVQVERRQRQ